MKNLISEESWIPDDVYKQITAFSPIPCVDLVVLRKTKNRTWEFLLIERKIEPEKGKWCLIGGRILKGETLQKAVTRQAEVELGVTVSILAPWDYNHPVAVFDNPEADPAKHPIINVYPVLITEGELKPGPESSELKWFTEGNLPEVMGFTHKKELEEVLTALREKAIPE